MTVIIFRKNISDVNDTKYNLLYVEYGLRIQHNWPYLNIEDIVKFNQNFNAIIRHAIYTCIIFYRLQKKSFTNKHPSICLLAYLSISTYIVLDSL